MMNEDDGDKTEYQWTGNRMNRSVDKQIEQIVTDLVLFLMINLRNFVIKFNLNPPVPTKIKEFAMKNWVLIKLWNNRELKIKYHY